VRVSDAVTGMLCILVAGALLIGARDLPDLPGQPFGPSLFPTAIGLALLPLAAVLTGRGIRRWYSERGSLVSMVELARSPRGLSNFGAVIAAILFYIIGSEFLGFILASMITLTFLMVQLRRQFWTSALIASVTTVVVHQFFYRVLLVPLPGGLLEFLNYW
jgi:putative tricarboxylic transport membrane protein